MLFHTGGIPEYNIKEVFKMTMIEIIEAFIKEGYTASSIETSGGHKKVIILLLRKGDLTISIGCDKYGHMYYTAEENGTPVSFHRNFTEIEKWKGDSYEIKIDEVFQPSEALTLLSDISHYSQISCIDFIVLLSQE